MREYKLPFGDTLDSPKKTEYCHLLQIVYRFLDSHEWIYSYIYRNKARGGNLHKLVAYRNHT